MRNECLFFDTSALLKRFLNERGSEVVSSLFQKATLIILSPITRIECVSAFRRLLQNREITQSDFHRLCIELEKDFNSYITMKLDADLEKAALSLIEKYPIKPGDAIQLACVRKLKKEIDRFVLSDQQLKRFALLEGIKIIDPTL